MTQIQPSHSILPGTTYIRKFHDCGNLGYVDLHNLFWAVHVVSKLLRIQHDTGWVVFPHTHM